MKRTALIGVAVLAFTAAAALPAQAKVTVVSIRTDFGYVNIAEVRAPKKGKCVDVPVVIDVRNPSNTPFGVDVAIVDEFENYYALTRWPRPPALTVGKYRDTMKVCGHAYQIPVPEGSGGTPGVAFNAKADYFVFAGAVATAPYGTKPYSFSH